MPSPIQRTLALLCALCIASARIESAPLATVQGAPPPPDTERPQGPLPVHEPPTEPGIAWFGTWSEALAEAERTGRPMLFMSAAPQCQRVPGVW
ncbi:MAG: hypothetical protein FJ298_01615 [Planctomycetes bacterium]|nr:hypothetical protein [Planctomycetota bacterium]